MHTVHFTNEGSKLHLHLTSRLEDEDLLNHPTLLSLRHPLVDGLTAREAQLVQDGMISPKFFGSMPTFCLGMQVCPDVFGVNLQRITHNFPVLVATSFRGFQGLRYLKS